MDGETNKAWKPSSVNLHLLKFHSLWPQCQMRHVSSILHYVCLSFNILFPQINNGMKASPLHLAWGHKKRGAMYWEETKTFVKDLGWMLVEEAHDWQSCFNARNNTANSENVSRGYFKRCPGGTEQFYSLNVLQDIWEVNGRKVRKEK